MKSGFQCDEGSYSSLESVEEGERRGEESETICAGLCHLEIAGVPAQHSDDSAVSWAVW